MDEMLCKDCDRVVPLEVPLCDDGPLAGELMCVLCGTAITVGGLLVVELPRAA